MNIAGSAAGSHLLGSPVPLTGRREIAYVWHGALRSHPLLRSLLEKECLFVRAQNLFWPVETPSVNEPGGAITGPHDPVAFWYG